MAIMARTGLSYDDIAGLDIDVFGELLRVLSGAPDEPVTRGVEQSVDDLPDEFAHPERYAS